MEATADSARERPNPKRRVRNYLIDRRFQLGWVLRVAVVTALIVAVMGYFLYDTVADATDQMLAAKMADPSLTEEAVCAFIDQAERDKLVTIAVLAGGFVGLVLVLSLFTIVVTHKVAGPIYKMKKLFGEIDGEHLQLWAKLRRGDELQDAFRAFDDMVRRLRESRHEDIDELEAIVEELRSEASSGDRAARRLEELLQRYRGSVRMS
jgi:nitrogen fixation/metabolism regulation signal transduction histidine kinase